MSTAEEIIGGLSIDHKTVMVSLDALIKQGQVYASSTRASKYSVLPMKPMRGDLEILEPNGRTRWMIDHRNMKFRLKEAEMYLQFLNEDLDLTESMDESIVSQINQLLKEATTRLRELANLLHMEARRKNEYFPTQ